MRVLRAFAQGLVSVTVGTLCASLWPVAAVIAIICRPALSARGLVPQRLQRINAVILRRSIAVRVIAHVFRCLAPAQSRTVLLWRRFLPVYLAYMWTDKRNAFRNPEARARAWAYRHEWGGIRVYSMVLELSGYYVKASQVLASKTEFMPQQWTQRLSRLFDDMPPQPWEVVRTSLTWQLQLCPLTTGGPHPAHHHPHHHHHRRVLASQHTIQDSANHSADPPSFPTAGQEDDGTHPVLGHHQPSKHQCTADLRKDQNCKVPARRRVPGTARRTAAQELRPPHLACAPSPSPSPASPLAPASAPPPSPPPSAATPSAHAPAMPASHLPRASPSLPVSENRCTAHLPGSKDKKPYRPPLPAPKLQQQPQQQPQQHCHLNGTPSTNQPGVIDREELLLHQRNAEQHTSQCTKQRAQQAGVQLEAFCSTSTHGASEDLGGCGTGGDGIGNGAINDCNGTRSNGADGSICCAVGETRSMQNSSNGRGVEGESVRQQGEAGGQWWLQRWLRRMRQRPGRGMPPVGLVEQYFEWVQPEALASASIAQVHVARMSQRVLDTLDPSWQEHAEVVMKVQHRHMERRMASDLANVGRLAAFLKGVLPFDPVPVVQEIQTAIPREFDFSREAGLTTAIREGLEAAGLAPAAVVVPRVLPQLCSPRLLVMERMEGLPFTSLLKRVAAGDTVLLPAAQEAARKLVHAFGHMVLRDGLFHADPHPGNLFLQVSPARCVLLDFGQCKALTAAQQLHLCHLVLALEAGEPLPIALCMAALGLSFGPPKGPRHRRKDHQRNTTDAAAVPAEGDTQAGAGIDLEAVAKVAYVMFDTRHMPEACISPFKNNPVLRRAPMKALPPFVWMLLRAVMLLRGLCHALQLDIQSAAVWKPLAEATLADPARVRAQAARNSHFL